MAIEKIGFSYPRGTIQSVYDTETLTALELASVTSKKVDECIDLVNGVEQTAIEATAVVDGMKVAQEQFVIENNDIRTQMLASQQALQTTIDGEIETFTQSATTELNTTKLNMTTALNTYKDNANDELATFTQDLNTSKATLEQQTQQVITNSTQQIQTNVNTKLDTMATDGTLNTIINQEIFTAIQQDVSENEIVVSEVEPVIASTWFEVSSETTFTISDGMIVVEI